MMTLLLKLDRQKQARLLKIATHAGALLPLAVLFYDFWYYRLGADPVREAILRTGKPALILLLLSLTITPLMSVAGWKQLQPLRRPLGLYAFLYVCLHLAIFAGIDYALNLRLILDGIVNNPYVVVGFTAFLLLIPLAATSTKASMRRLGKNWKRLHKLTYLIGILAIWHFLWLVKDNGEALIYAGILAFLFLLRFQPIRQPLIRWRRNLQNRRQRPAANAPARKRASVQPETKL